MWSGRRIYSFYEQFNRIYKDGNGFCSSNIRYFICCVGGEKNYNIAFILVSLATCLHIHEGIYGFGTIFIILVSETIYKRKIELRNVWTIFISIIVIFSVALSNPDKPEKFIL